MNDAANAECASVRIRSIDLNNVESVAVGGSVSVGAVWDGGGSPAGGAYCHQDAAGGGAG